MPASCHPEYLSARPEREAVGTGSLREPRLLSPHPFPAVSGLCEVWGRSIVSSESSWHVVFLKNLKLPNHWEMGGLLFFHFTDEKTKTNGVTFNNSDNSNNNTNYSNNSVS